MIRCMSTCAVDKATSAHAVNHTLHAIHGKSAKCRGQQLEGGWGSREGDGDGGQANGAQRGGGGGKYRGCEGGKAACRGLTGSPSGLRNLSLGRQVCSGVRGVPLLAGEN